MFRSSILLLCLTVSLHAADKSPPVGPVTEGMTFEGVFKSGKKDKFGILRDPYVSNFKLKFLSVDGEAFEGRWEWEDKKVTKVEGKIKKNGDIELRWTADIKGKSVAVFDAKAAGKVSATELKLHYNRPSAKRVGSAEAKVVDEKDKGKGKGKGKDKTGKVEDKKDKVEDKKDKVEDEKGKGEDKKGKVEDKK